MADVCGDITQIWLNQVPQMLNVDHLSSLIQSFRENTGLHHNRMHSVACAR